MEHHAPHPLATFEGYYHKFALPSGAHLVVIVCTIRRRIPKPHILSCTYVPRANTARPWQRDIHPAAINMVQIDKCNDKYSGIEAFTLQIHDIGFIHWTCQENTTVYDLTTPDLRLHARSGPPTPWSATTRTPEGRLIALPLPSHWHVHSLASRSTFKLHLRDFDLPACDTSGVAVVHEEKTWALTFPPAFVWIQARDGDDRDGDRSDGGGCRGRGLCLAGGVIIGVHAFLVGYRGGEGGVDVDFRPPFAVQLPIFGSPWVSSCIDRTQRRVNLSVQTLWQKIVIAAWAPEGSFFGLAAPYAGKFKSNFLAQSFEAQVDVWVYQKSWVLGSWKLVCEDRFERASLGLGGAYYPRSGSAQVCN